MLLYLAHSILNWTRYRFSQCFQYKPVCQNWHLQDFWSVYESTLDPPRAAVLVLAGRPRSCERAPCAGAAPLPSGTAAARRPRALLPPQPCAGAARGSGCRSAREAVTRRFNITPGCLLLPKLGFSAELTRLRHLCAHVAQREGLPSSGHLIRGHRSYEWRRMVWGVKWLMAFWSLARIWVDLCFWLWELL